MSATIPLSPLINSSISTFKVCAKSNANRHVQHSTILIVQLSDGGGQRGGTNLSGGRPPPGPHVEPPLSMHDHQKSTRGCRKKRPRYALIGRLIEMLLIKATKSCPIASLGLCRPIDFLLKTFSFSVLTLNHGSTR